MSTLKEIESSNVELTLGSVKGLMKLAGAGSKDLWGVPPASLVVLPGFNPRIRNESYLKRVRVIADSIKREGFYQHMPIGAFADAKHGLVVRAGFTRLEAALLAISEGAELEVVPVVVQVKGVGLEDITVAFVKDNTSQTLSIYEAGIAAKRLCDMGHEPKAISVRLDFSETHVNNLLKLMSSPLKLREMVAYEKVSGSLVMEMLVKMDGTKALEKLEAAAKEKPGKKVTAKSVEVPGKDFAKMCKKQGKDLFLVLTDICESNLLKDIDDETHKRLCLAMEPIEEADDRDEAMINADREASRALGEGEVKDE